MNNRSPNVLVFFTDQQRWDTTGVHGCPLDLTPNFDRMAQRGTHVARSFTCQPVCGPARACLQTGLYPTMTGCFTNHIPLPQNSRTLAHHFAQAGYATGYIGKWHLAGADPVPAHERGGYDYWLAANRLEWTSDAYRCELFDGSGRRVRLPGYRADAVADAAIRYLAARSGERQPFYLFVSLLEPHQQNSRDDYPPPLGWRDRYAGRWMPPDLAALGGSAHAHLAGYCGMIKRVDECLGRVLDALHSLGLARETIVLYTSDHACHFKTRNSEYKRSCHESSIRVPTAFCGPGFDGGGRVGQLVSLIDLPPTLLDAAGLPVPPEMQGRSIIPLLHGAGVAEDRGVEWSEEVFIQISEEQVARALRTHRWKYSVSAPDKDPWHDSASDRYQEEFLYDLENDPHELTNLAGFEAFVEVSAALRERLVARMKLAGENAPVAIEPAPSRQGGTRRVDLFPQ